MAFALTNGTGMTVDDTGQVSDDQLMVAYRRGDQRSFDSLYDRYRQPLYGYLYRHCYNETQAGELFQDVWLRVIASSKRYEHKGKFRSWIFTVAHNCLVDFYRRNEKQQQEVYEESEGGPNPGDEVMGIEIDSMLEKALLRLPADQRQAFYLREEQGFSVKEIAEIQNISTEAAKSRLRYAYGKLRVSLKEQHREA